MAAEDHCRETGERGMVGHEGLNNMEPWDRVDKYGEWHTLLSESIAYGNISGDEFMIELFIDD